MLKQRFSNAQYTSAFCLQSGSPFALEQLEDRRLLSGGPCLPHHGGFGGGPAAATIQFSQAPSAVQTGLNALATAASLTAPTADQTVFLRNSNGVESYTVDIAGTGTDTKLTVDQNGNPVTAPTVTSTTFGLIANTAVTNEFTAIATALKLTAPDAATAVTVSTASNGTATYSVTLSSATTTSSKRKTTRTTITVDSNGNPVGNIFLPLSTLSTAIQNGLATNAPAGAAALASTYLVNIRTENGVTFYSATYKTTGVQTTVTVNSAGVLTSLPSVSKVLFSTLPQAAKDELQALATAAGVTGDIAADQSVVAYDEANGTTIYSVKLPVTTTDSDGNTFSRPITLSVDQNGNPTVPPNAGEGGGRLGGPGGGSRDRHAPPPFSSKPTPTKSSTGKSTAKIATEKTVAVLRGRH
jgi:hypothetical protein